jgi:hypothetical protein
VTNLLVNMKVQEVWWGSNSKELFVYTKAWYNLTEVCCWACVIVDGREAGYDAIARGDTKWIGICLFLFLRVQ